MTDMKKENEIRKSEIISNLKICLKDRGMTQRDLSVLLNKKEPEISRWLSGRTCISKKNQELLEKTLGTPLSSDSMFIASHKTVNIGIIGTGDMAQRFVNEAKFVKDIVIATAYNPDIHQAINFCKSNNIPICSKSTDELMDNSDAVYIASPIDSHYEYIIAAIQKRKHILCEMPFLLTDKEITAVFKLAAKKNVVLMPALKTAYCPSFLQIASYAESGIIGEIVDISATVTNLLSENVSSDFSNERMLENLSYPIHCIFKFLGYNYRSFNCFVKKNGNRTLFANVTLKYADAVGSFKVGVGVKSEGSLVISGTKGYIYVPAPWWKPDYFEIRFENPAENKKFFFPYEEAGLRYETAMFRDRIRHADMIIHVSTEELLKMTALQNRIFNST